MKQQIVVKVKMNCDKCRSMALQIAASVNGVSEVKLAGDERDQVAVTGGDVDTVSLTRSLKNKVGHATIVSVAVIDPEPAPAPAPAPAAPAENSDTTLATIARHQHLYPYPYPWQPFPYYVIW